MIYTDLNTEIDVGSSGHLIEFGPFRALVDCLQPNRRAVVEVVGSRPAM